MKIRSILLWSLAPTCLAGLAVFTAGGLLNRYARLATEIGPGHRWVALTVRWRFLTLVRRPPAYKSPMEAVYRGTIPEGGLFVQSYSWASPRPRREAQLTVSRSRTWEPPGTVSRRLRRRLGPAFSESEGWPPSEGACPGRWWAQIHRSPDPEARVLCQALPGVIEGALVTRGQARQDTWIYLFEVLTWPQAAPLQQPSRP